MQCVACLPVSSLHISNDEMSQPSTIKALFASKHFEGWPTCAMWILIGGKYVDGTGAEEYF